MSDPLKDLNFEINAHVRDAMEDIKELGAKLDDVFKHVDKIDQAFRSLGQSMGLPAAQVELLLLRIQPLVNTLAKADKQAASLEESFTRKLMQKALEDHNRKVITLADGTQRARYEMIKLADASMQLRIPTQSPRAPDAGGGAGGGVNFVRVTAAAAQLGLMARLNQTMRSVGSSVETVGRQSAITASHMTRFRMGLQAVDVNPRMNVVKNGFDALGGGASKAVDKIRGVADAILSDIPGAANAAIGAVGSLNSAFDSVSATASKHVAKLQSMQQAASLLATVFPFAAETINKFRAPLDVVVGKAEEVAMAIDTMNANVGAAASDMRGKLFVATGAFTQLGATTDIFARSQFHALLPMRLFAREFEGALRIVKVATHAYAFVTHPIHAMAVAAGNSSAQFRHLRATLPPLTGGLQLGVRAHRALSHATFFTATSIMPLINGTRSLVRLLTPAANVTFRAARAVGSGLGSAALQASGAVARLTVNTGAAILKMTGLGTVAGVAQGAFQKLTGSVNSAGNTINSRFTVVKGDVGSLNTGFSGLISKAAVVKTALVAGAVAMVGFSASTAMATEKNNVVFGTMLHDMEQGAAVVQSLQNTKAAGLFDNQELLDSGRLLFKAGVSAAQLGAKTDQLATIAVATSTELGDLTRIYQQGANAGSFGLDKINQLAERGIDIYGGLTAATGASGGELKKLISDGKIGLTEMDAALAHLTDKQGIYAGAIDNVANTTSGMLSQIKNNTQQILGGLAGPILERFKPVLMLGVMITATLKENLLKIAPIVTMAFSAVNSAFALVGSVAQTIFGNIFAGGKWSFDALLDKTMVFFTTVKFAFDNFGAVAKFGWDLFTLYAVSAFEKIKHFFLAEAPAYLRTFGLNMRNLLTGRELVETVLPERQLSALEAELTAAVKNQSEILGGELDKKIAEARALLNAEVKGPELKDTKDSSGKAGGSESAADKASARAAENKAILVRSSEGASLIGQMQKALGKTDIEKKAHAAQVAALQELKDIKNDARRRKQVAAGPGF